VALCATQVFVLCQYALSPSPGLAGTIQLRPLSTIGQQTRVVLGGHTDDAKWAALTQLAGNGLLLAPLAVATALLTQMRIRTIGALAIATSTAVEAYQWFGGTGRIADVDDVVLNTLGCLLVFTSIRLTLRPFQARPIVEESPPPAG